MPRGVYDRSKSKEQRASEKANKASKAASPKKAPKAAKAAAPVKKETEPKADKQQKISTSSKVHTHDLDVGTKFAIVRENIATLGNTVQNLVTGQQTVIQYSVGPMVDLLDGELKANIEVLSSLRREVFGLSETETAAAAAAVETETVASPDSDEEEEAPTASTALAQPGIVPMPPAPPPPAGFPAQ